MIKNFNTRFKHVVPTTTETSQGVEDIFILTYYINNSVKAFIAFRDGASDAVEYKQGDLVIKINTPVGVTFKIVDGYLIAEGENADKYSIDDDGNLIYTE